MADITLKAGKGEKAITFDLYKMTYKEWQSLFDPKTPDVDSAEMIARVAGMTREELDGLPFPSYKKLLAALLKRARDPESDPNE